MQVTSRALRAASDLETVVSVEDPDGSELRTYGIWKRSTGKQVATVMAKDRFEAVSKYLRAIKG